MKRNGGPPTGTCHCRGVVCGEGELVNNPGVCVALPLPPTHLVKRQNERDREFLYTHPQENDKFGSWMWSWICLVAPEELAKYSTSAERTSMPVGGYRAGRVRTSSMSET